MLVVDRLHTAAGDSHRNSGVGLIGSTPVGLRIGLSQCAQTEDDSELQTKSLVFKVSP